MQFDPTTGEYIRLQAVTWGPRILIAALIVLVTWIIARTVKWALQKTVDRVRMLQQHQTGAPGETVGQQLGTIAQLIVWLVGIMAALQFLGIGQILDPINRLTIEIFAFLPRLLGAGLVFFVGLIVARIARKLVETLLVASHLSRFLGRAGISYGSSASSTPVSAAASGPTPGAIGDPLARAGGILVFALIIIPVAIAALQVLGIAAISVPATNMLNEILAAIPRLLTAALWLGIAFIAGKFLKTVIEGVLPPTGFDDAVRATGVLPAKTKASRIVADVAFTAIMLTAAVEAAKQLGGTSIAVFLAQVIELGGKVIFGSLIIVVGIFLARIVSNLIGAADAEAGFAQRLARYAIIAFSAAIGLTFMGLANVIVVMAFGLILGSAAVAAALAFGLGGREAAAQMLRRYADRADRESIDQPPSPPLEPSAPRRD